MDRTNLFLDKFDKFLTEQLGEDWSYKYDAEDGGLGISLQVWGNGVSNPEDEQEKNNGL